METVVTPREILHAVIKHRLAAGTAFIVTLLVVGVVTFTTKPTYQSTAALLVKLGREFAQTPDVGDRNPTSDPRNRVALVNAEAQILLSEDLISTVVASVGEKKLYPDLVEEPGDSQGLRAAAVAKFLLSYSVNPMVDASVIRISFSHRDPVMAAHVVNLTVDRFKEKHLRAFGDPETAAFLEQKVVASRKTLEDSEDKIQTFQAANKPFLDRGDMIHRQREETVASLRTIGNDIAGLKEKLTYLNREKETSLQQLEPAAKTDPVVAETRARLLQLQLEEQKLLGGFKEDSRQVTNVRKQIALVQKFLEEQEAAAKGAPSGLSGQLGTQVIDTQGQLLSLEAKKSRIEQQLASLDVQLADLPRLDAEYRDLIRERDTNEKNFQTYASSLEQARISGEMDRQKIANVSVIQAGVVPTEPISPKKKLNLAIGVLLGGVLGVGLAFVLEMRSAGAQRRIVMEAPRPGEPPTSRAKTARGVL